MSFAEVWMVRGRDFSQPTFPLVPGHDLVAEITLNVVKLPDIKRGLALLPRHRVIERDVGRTTRLRPLARAQERLAEVPGGRLT